MNLYNIRKEEIIEIFWALMDWCFFGVFFFSIKYESISSIFQNNINESFFLASSEAVALEQSK